MRKGVGACRGQDRKWRVGVGRVVRRHGSADGVARGSGNGLIFGRRWRLQKGGIELNLWMKPKKERSNGVSVAHMPGPLFYVEPGRLTPKAQPKLGCGWAISWAWAAPAHITDWPNWLV